MKVWLIIWLVFLVNNCQLIEADFLTWFADKFADEIPPHYVPGDDAIYAETMLSASEICKNHGYSFENHTVTTKDGYNLDMFRIPEGRQGQRGGYSVLLMHGILTSALFWLDSAEYNLAFYLADNGFDVWMGNFRGNEFTSHVKYSKNDRRFWDFSIDELADLDCPAMVDYVLETTVKTKLVYIGHSMGTTAGFAFLASQKSYHKKIAGYIALSPITGLYYTPSLLRPIIPFGETLTNTLQLLGVHSLLTIPKKLLKLEQRFCPNDDTIICGSLFDASGGYDPYLRNNTRNFIYVAHAAGGVSTKTLTHFSQIYSKKSLHRFDYGLLKNVYSYKALDAPSYDLTSINIPVVLIHSPNDALGNPIDVQLLSRKLPNLLGKKLIDFAMFDHLDIGYAMTAEELFQKDVVGYLRQM